MITVLTNPCAHNFSKSPVICELETDNAFYSGDFGDKAKFIFYLPPTPTIHSHFKVETGSVSSWFYFTNGVPSSPYVQIPLRGIGVTDLDYYNDILAIILADSAITTNYNVTYVGGGGFLFEALLPGSTHSNTTSSVGGVDLSFTNLVNGTTNMLTDVPRPNYKIGIDVYVQTERTVPVAVMQKVYSGEKSPFNNKVKFDLQKIVNAYLDYYFPTPNQSISNVALQACKLFQVVIRELYGSPIVEYVPTCAPDPILVAPGSNDLFPKDILKAGFAPRWNKIQPQNQLDAYIWNYPLNLTVRPYVIKIKKEQPEYIFFCFPADCLEPVVKLTSYFEDGTNAVTYQYKFTGTMYKGFVGCFPIKPSGSTIMTNMAAGNAIKFTAQIVADADHATGISPLVTYIPDYNPLGDDRIFLFSNSMGGCDTFRSEGYYEQDVEIEREVSSRIYYTTDDAHIGDEVTSQSFKTNILKAYSGWKTADEIHALEDLLLAEYKVEIFEYTQYMPITIVSKKYRKHKTNEFLKAIEIEYYHQIKSPVTDRLAAAL
jgi:hypothetical protein